jgi:hypothetical protein
MESSLSVWAAYIAKIVHLVLKKKKIHAQLSLEAQTHTYRKYVYNTFNDIIIFLIIYRFIIIF